jgi:hypothetical protein
MNLRFTNEQLYPNREKFCKRGDIFKSKDGRYYLLVGVAVSIEDFEVRIVNIETGWVSSGKIFVKDPSRISENLVEDYWNVKKIPLAGRDLVDDIYYFFSEVYDEINK